MLDHRLTATMRHLTDSAGRVYMLTMEGLLFEVDVQTLKATVVVNVIEQMGIKARPHFKGGFTGAGKSRDRQQRPLQLRRQRRRAL